MDDPKTVQDQDAQRQEQALLSGFCQDIESPLNVILTGAEFLAEAGRRSPGCYTPQQERALQSIQDSAAVLGRMAENILDAYRCLNGGAPARPQAMELVSHLGRMAELVAPCAARQGVKLSFSAGAQSLAVMADRILADRVVLNLLSNAVYHGGARGNVWMELEPGEGRHLLRVRDDGPGFPAALADRLNGGRPFSPPASRGSGLGLYLCREFCKVLGWHMHITSSPQGACVELTIPSGWDAAGELHSSPVSAMLEADGMRRMVQREFARP